MFKGLSSSPDKLWYCDCLGPTDTSSLGYGYPNNFLAGHNFILVITSKIWLNWLPDTFFNLLFQCWCQRRYLPKIFQIFRRWQFLYKRIFGEIQFHFPIINLIHYNNFDSLIQCPSSVLGQNLIRRPLTETLGLCWNEITDSSPAVILGHTRSCLSSSRTKEL